MGNSLVLIVEDDPDHREILRSVLEDWLGARARLAANGEAALATLAEIAPDLIVLDLLLPDMQGLSLLAQLRSHPHALQAPIVVVSALAHAEMREQVLASGANYYLAKPFDLVELAAIAERLLTLALLRPSNEQAGTSWRETSPPWPGRGG